MYLGQPNVVAAREVAEKYKNYPVLSWRKMFSDLAELISEFDGDEISNAEKKDENSLTKNQTESMTEPELSAEIENKKIILNYKNLSECFVNYYMIDVEVLFSENPFLKS